MRGVRRLVASSGKTGDAPSFGAHAFPSLPPGARARAARLVDRRRREPTRCSARRRDGELLGQEVDCPPGYLSEEQLELRERREQRSASRPEGGSEQEAEREREGEAEGCRAGKGPEPIGELLQIQTESGRRSRGGQGGVKTGAYAAAVARPAAIARASGTLPGSAGTWDAGRRAAR